MSSQLAQNGDMGLVNDLAGNSIPLVQSGTPAAPPSFDQIWINTGSGNSINQWVPVTGGLTGAWSAAAPVPGTRYLALLATDPVAGGAVWVGDLVELTTSGYSRQLCDFGNASATYPSSCANLTLVTFGPMSASMVVPVQWVALVTSSSGTGGYFLASWLLAAPIQVSASQSIMVSPGQLVIQGQ